MVPDFSSFVRNTSCAECCVVYSGHIHVAGSSGRVCRQLDLKDVFLVAESKFYPGSGSGSTPGSPHQLEMVTQLFCFKWYSLYIWHGASLGQ